MNLRYPIHVYLLLVSCFFAIHSNHAWAQSEESGLDKFKTAMDEAAAFFKQKDLPHAAERVNVANKALTELFEKKMTAADFEKVKQMYPRLKKAHELISEKNVDVDKLVVLPTKLPTGNNAKAGNSKISFTKQVAPILIQNCGGCHIQKSQGQVNFSTFQQLLDSPKKLVNPTDLTQSSLFAAIENNKMPPKRPLNDKDKKLIKQWFEEGAEFDGKDKDKQQLMSNYKKK